MLPSKSSNLDFSDRLPVQSVKNKKNIQNPMDSDGISKQKAHGHTDQPNQQKLYACDSHHYETQNQHSK